MGISRRALFGFRNGHSDLQYAILKGRFSFVDVGIYWDWKGRQATG
jgi:hypothetical protein